MYHYSDVNCSSVTFADGVMEGQGRNIATIYGSSAGMTESRDGLADNKTGNAIRGSTRSIP
jgi:hypothetical protein